MSTDPTTLPAPRQARTLSQALVVTGILIAVANMTLAWVLMFTRPTDVPAASAHAAAHATAEGAVTTDASSPLLVETMRTLVRSEQARQLVNSNILMLTIAFSFALMSIGFSLFVMGIEGALSLHGKVPALGSLMLTTASPGILCIVLSTLTLMALLVFTQMTFGDTQEAAKAEAIRAEADAKVRLIDAEASAKERQNLELEAARSRREAEEQQVRFEQQLELERVRAQAAPQTRKAR